MTGDSSTVNIVDLLIGATDDIDVEPMASETLYALATYEGDLTVATAAIIELGGRRQARAAALDAVRLLLASGWADRHLKAAALGAAFRADPLAAVGLAADVLRTTREPLLIDAMIRGVMDEPSRLLEDRGFRREQRAVATTVEPDPRCDRDLWQAFVGATLAVDLQSDDRETVYDAIIAAGKQDRRELTPAIEPFLKGTDAGLREAALKTLGFYWGLQAHRATARAALSGDPDLEVRIAAAMALATLASGACEDLSLLVAVALDTAADEWVRDAAFDAALFVAGIARRDFPLARRVPGFDANADWGLLLEWLERAAQPVPDRLRELVG